MRAVRLGRSSGEVSLISPDAAGGQVDLRRVGRGAQLQQDSMAPVRDAYTVPEFEFAANSR